MSELGALQEYFAGRLPERLREIEEAWRAVQGSAWSDEPLRLFHRLAHSLAGAGATFGFPAVTEASRDLEQRLKAVIQGSPPPEGSEVELLLDRLSRSAAGSPTPPGSSASAPRSTSAT